MSSTDPYGPYGAPGPGGAGHVAPGYGAPSWGAPGDGTPGYGAPSYGAPPPPRRRRGMKRMVLGGLGLLANAVGLLVLPILGALVGTMIALAGTGDPVPVDPAGGSIPLSGTSIVWVSVPEAEVGSATCEFTGRDLEVDEDPNPSVETGTMDGSPAVKAYSLSSVEDQQVTVTCEGASSVGYQSIGAGSTLLSLGIGLVIPIVLGTLSLVLLIWGIVARVRS